ncbi:GntR family transcriptional regulator [Pseudothermotoga thermarum]|uniref:Transcriptional regulator, GntR family n=1 Tax=Pseudothermotoga thermarum DSM 5069 TaxID=688269 RepID=F7YVD6_9THEM|nr:GntR family transcriptional regulator [Pseudothermotoga thermarum]AEH50439.1 transcriptional regulator, GntR family [Pseudothermotoga thermarum DSM 5069]
MDKDYPVPLYYKVYRDLKQKILDGIYKPGDKIPPESELVAIYNVSRLTIRRALEELRSEGFITRAKGRGTFITGRKEEEQMNVLKGFTDKAKEEGFSVRSLVLENKLVEIPSELVEVFGLEPGTMIILLKRVRYMNDEPVAIESAYLNTSVDVRILNILKKDMSKESLYEFLRNELKIPLLRALEEFEVTQISPSDAKLLSVNPGACALLRKRYTYTTNNRCIEYVRSIYRGDKYRFKIELRTSGAFEK